MFYKNLSRLLDNINLNLSQISVLLISISIIFWSISIYFSKVNIGDYGLINGLHPLFFISVIILIISFFINIKFNIKNNKLLILHLLILIIFNISIPLLIEGTPRFPYNFETTLNVDYILKYAHSNVNAINYQNWPGLFYFDSIITLISNISPFDSILIIPVLFNLTFGILLSYLLYSTFLNKKETWTALLLSNVLFFGSPIYLVPGVIGGAMTLFALLVLFRFIFFENRDSIGLRIILLIFISAAVTSHFLSTAYLIIVLIFISILQLIFKKNANRTFILVFVMLMSWQLYLAGSFALEQISGSVHTAFNLESTLSAAQESAFGGSQSHSQVFYVKLLSIFLLSFIALIGLFYEIIWKRKITFKNLTLPTWITANLSMTFLTSYGGEVLSRTFSVSTGVLDMLAAKTINNNKLSLILLFVLLISPPLSIINAYGNEAVDYVSPVEIEGSNFMFNHYENNSAIKILGVRVWNRYYLTGLEHWIYDPTNMTIENLFPLNERQTRDNFFVLVGKRDMEGYKFLNGPTDFSYLENLDNSKEYNRIYDAPDYIIYYISGVKKGS